MDCLVDTGVLLRLFDRSDVHYVDIRNAVRGVTRQGMRLVTTAQNVAEFWNVSTRPASARGGYGHPVDRVDRRVAAIERICHVLTEDEAS